MIFFAVNGKLLNSLLEWKFEDKWRTILPVLPTSFFMLVVIVNLNSWSFYYFKIEEMAVSAEEYIDKSKHVKKYKATINYLTVIACSIVIAYTIAICIKGTKKNVNLFDDISYATGVCLIITGILFWIQGILINLTIRENFAEFYYENRTILWLVTVMLSAPILVRGGIDIARVVDMDFKKSISDNGPVFTPLFYIFTDLFPMCFQLSSLVFGFIRHRRNKQIR